MSLIRTIYKSLVYNSIFSEDISSAAIQKMTLKNIMIFIGFLTLLQTWQVLMTILFSICPIKKYYIAQLRGREASLKKKKKYTPSFSRLRQFIEVLGASCWWQRKIGTDLVWKISDRSLKFHIKYRLCYLLSHTSINLA